MPGDGGFLLFAGGLFAQGRPRGFQVGYGRGGIQQLHPCGNSNHAAHVAVIAAGESTCGDFTLPIADLEACCSTGWHSSD
jgi:hypothetical protein